MRVLGRSVRLSTEDLAIGPNGRLVDRGGRAGGAAETFAATFTARYPQIADRSPVFAALRNGIDLLVLAAFMRQAGWQRSIDWDAAALRDERTVATETLPPSRLRTAWRRSGRRSVPRRPPTAGGGTDQQAM